MEPLVSHPPDPLAERVEEACRDLGMEGHGVVVGVSGGPDSVTLLLLLHELDRSGRLPLHLEVAHLHHGLRGAEADDDLRFVRTLAGELGRPFHGAEEDVGERARRLGLGQEHAGRQARYSFFGQIAGETGARFVATGHNRDDQAETVLLRILRGTGVTGLSSIHRARPLEERDGVKVVRPLLSASRAEILDYLRKRGRPYRVDRTNSDPAFSRNRLRATLLPALRRIDPGVDETLAGLAGDALDLRNALETYGGSRPSPGFERLPEGVLVPPPPLRSGHLDEASVFRAAFSAAGGDPRRLARTHLAALRALWEGSGETAATLPGDVPARRTDRGLLFPDPPGEPVPLPGPVELPLAGEARFGRWILALKPSPPPALAGLKQARRNGTEHLDLAPIRLPLRIRCRRPGDRFHPLGGPGTMRLKEFFRASGVPGPDRDRVPLVEDASGRVVQVVGFRIAHWARITPGTREALRLTARRVP